LKGLDKPYGSLQKRLSLIWVVDQPIDLGKALEYLGHKSSLLGLIDQPIGLGRILEFFQHRQSLIGVVDQPIGLGIILESLLRKSLPDGRLDRLKIDHFLNPVCRP
jgi:hypothetical protein